MDITRALVIVLAWFATWMIVGALVAGEGGAAAGFLLAYLTGFGLPWIIPEKLQQWMDGPSSS